MLRLKVRGVTFRTEQRGDGLGAGLKQGLGRLFVLVKKSTLLDLSQVTHVMDISATGTVLSLLCRNLLPDRCSLVVFWGRTTNLPCTETGLPQGIL